MSARIERTIEVRKPGDALALLAAETGLSRTRLKQAMTKGAVWLTRAGTSLFRIIRRSSG